MEDTLSCNECNGDVIRFLVSANQFTKTKKEYGDHVREIGERVRVTKGWRCRCTYLTGSLPDRPENWPDHWLENEE